MGACIQSSRSDDVSYQQQELEETLREDEEGTEKGGEGGEGKPTDPHINIIGERSSIPSASNESSTSKLMSREREEAEAKSGKLSQRKRTMMIST